MNDKKVIIFICIIMLIMLAIILSTLLSKDNKTYAIGDTLADTVIAQSKGDTWDAGDSGVYYTNNHEYRYIGANVNNYVSFNDDLYRIIGVFDSNSHGQDGKMLVKLIRSRILGGYSWGVYNSTSISGEYSNYGNDWTGTITGVKANLNILLNEYFYNKINVSNTYGTCDTWTYFRNNINYRIDSCSDIIGYGINETLSNLIEDSIWYLYGYHGDSLSREGFYMCERGQYEGCTNENLGGYSSSINAKIGLMYVSDYLYASGYYGSNSTTISNSNSFGSQNWLYNGYEWTITPKPNSINRVFYIDRVGNIYNNFSYFGFGIRPTFYLKSSVYVTGGTGTFDDPYTISCDDCN